MPSLTGYPFTIPHSSEGPARLPAFRFHLPYSAILTKAVTWLLVACWFGWGLAEVRAAEHEVLLVLDNSGSMKTNDPQFLTHRAVESFVDSLGSNVEVGILVFDEQPELVLPVSLLFDSRDPQLQAALSQLNYGGQWTDTANALERAIYELKSRSAGGARQSVILMTDGIVDTGDPNRDRDKVAWMKGSLIKLANREGVRLYGIAFTEKADFQLIQTLAVETGGDYFRILDPAEMAATFTRLLEGLMAPLAEPEPPATLPPGETETVAALPAAPAAAETGAEIPPNQQRPTPVTPAAESPVDNRLLYGGFVLLLVLLGVIILLVLRRPRDGAEKVLHAKLQDLHQGTGRDEIDLEGGLYVIGRVGTGGEEGAKYVVIPDNKVSRRHAIIRFHDAGHWISDQGGRNGTFVNEERVEKEHLLKQGDIVRVSMYEFRYLIPGLETEDETQFGGGLVKPAVFSAASPAEVSHPVEEPQPHGSAFEADPAVPAFPDLDEEIAAPVASGNEPVDDVDVTAVRVPKAEEKPVSQGRVLDLDAGEETEEFDLSAFEEARNEGFISLDDADDESKQD